MSVVRAAGIRGLRATVAELGGDAEAYGARAGLPAGALDADDLLVPQQAVADVLEIAARELGYADLGLRVASRQGLTMLGTLALAIQASATVGDALECTSRYLFVHADSLTLAPEPDPYGAESVVALRYRLEPPDAAASKPQGVDLSLGFLHRALTFLAGTYGLLTVELPHRPVAPVRVYKEFFGAPVHTNCPWAALRVPAGLVRRPLPTGDTRLRELALAVIAEQAPPRSRLGVASQVRAAVQRTLGTAVPGISLVADLLSMHPRTLQRRLRAEGTSFEQVLDEERREAARRHLTSTDMPLGQIAGLLGLSQQATFTRCCKRWWGMTPTQARRTGVL